MLTETTHNKHARNEAAVTLLTLPYFQPDGESVMEQTGKVNSVRAALLVADAKAAPLGTTIQLSARLLRSAEHRTGTRAASSNNGPRQSGSR